MKIIPFIFDKYNQVRYKNHESWFKIKQSEKRKLERVKYYIEVKKLDMYANAGHIMRFAIAKGCIDIIEYLISIGFDYSFYSNCVLRISASYGRLEIFKYFEKICVQNDDVRFCLRYACSNKNNYHMINYLLSNYEIKLDNNISSYFKCTDIKIIKLFVTKGGLKITNFVLFHAIQKITYINVKIIKYLLSELEFDQTSIQIGLFSAIKVKISMHKKSNLNYVSKFRNKQLKIIKYLISIGGNPLNKLSHNDANIFHVNLYSYYHFDDTLISYCFDLEIFKYFMTLYSEEINKNINNYFNYHLRNNCLDLCTYLLDEKEIDFRNDDIAKFATINHGEFIILRGYQNHNGMKISNKYKHIVLKRILPFLIDYHFSYRRQIEFSKSNLADINVLLIVFRY